MRYAIVRGQGITTTKVQEYMPRNYEVLCYADGGVLIGGEDNAGWTMQDYVLPRLASGLYFGNELTELEQGLFHSIDEEGK